MKMPCRTLVLSVRRAAPLKAALLKAALLSAVLLSSTVAHADRAECSPAYEQAQRLRKAGKLLDSRASLLTCSQDECPAFVRKDCGEWLKEVEREIPSVSVRVVGRDGCDRPDVAVFLDEREATGAADGRAIAADPGTHALRAELDGEKITQTIVLARSERGRIVTLSLGSTATCGVALPPPPPPPRASGDTSEHETGRPVPALAFILGGVGVVGLGVGTAFSVSGWSQRSTLDDCKGSCSRGDVSDARRSFVVGDVSLGIGLAALAAAAVIYLTR